MRRAWSAAAESKLRSLYATTPLPRLAFLLKRSPGAVKSRAANLGLRKSGRIDWTPAIDRKLRKLYPHSQTAKVAELMGLTVRQVNNRAHSLGLKKSAKYLASGEACRFNGHEPGSVVHRFKKGQTPPNKGLRRPGWAPGRMAQTQFKKGELSGRARALLKPIGATRIVYGNLERKVTNGGPYPAKRWQPVHRIVWEAAHGPVPAGHIAVFKPGMHTIVESEITLDRIELITRVENMRRNTYHNYPKEIAHAIQMRGALSRQINRITKGNPSNV